MFDAMFWGEIKDTDLGRFFIELRAELNAKQDADFQPARLT
jgi:hypothetical protein